MKYMPVRVYVFALPIVLLCVFFAAADKPARLPNDRAGDALGSGAEMTMLFEQLRLSGNDHFEARIKASEELRRRFRNLGEEILKVAATEKKEYAFYDERGLAAQLLAAMSTDYKQEVVPLCIEHIEYFQPGVITSFDSLQGFVFAQALRDVGLSALPELFVYLERDRAQVSDTAIDLISKVIFQAHMAPGAGGDFEALAMMERATKRARNNENHRRVLGLMYEKMRKMHPEFKGPEKLQGP